MCVKRILIVAFGLLIVNAACGQLKQLGLEGLFPDLLDLPDLEKGDYSISIGAGVTPDYEGSDDYQPIPVIAFRAKWERYTLLLNGPNGSLSVSRYKRWEFGPAFGLNMGREDVDDAVVDLLRDIDIAFEAGAFVGWWTSPKWLDKDQLILRATFLHDLTSEHDGFTVDFGVRYAFQALQMLRLSTGPSATFASEDYMDTFFSIDANNAARSGLPTYTADGGIKDVGWNATATFFLSRKWNVNGFVVYRRLLGDAKDSPIVQQRGSENQFTGGASVGYRW